MKTVCYNYYSFEGAKASGGEDRRAILVRECAPRRPASGDKVISLEDYRAKKAGLEQPVDAPWEKLEPCASDRRPAGRARETLLAALELAACGAIIAVAAVACAVFLL